jgi:hypothetical protein
MDMNNFSLSVELDSDHQIWKKELNIIKTDLYTFNLKIHTICQGQRISNS